MNCIMFCLHTALLYCYGKRLYAFLMLRKLILLKPNIAYTAINYR